MVQELSRHLGRRLFPRLLGAALLMLLAAAPSQAVKRRAFVTSVSGNGNLFTWAGATGLTGIERADSVCRARATAGGLPNNSGQIRLGFPFVASIAMGAARWSQDNINPVLATLPQKAKAAKAYARKKGFNTAVAFLIEP